MEYLVLPLLRMYIAYVPDEEDENKSKMRFAKEI